MLQILHPIILARNYPKFDSNLPIRLLFLLFSLLWAWNGNKTYFGPHRLLQRRRPIPRLKSHAPSESVVGLEDSTLHKMLNKTLIRLIQKVLGPNLMKYPENLYVAVWINSSEHLLVAVKPLSHLPAIHMLIRLQNLNDFQKIIFVVAILECVELVNIQDLKTVIHPVSFLPQIILHKQITDF